MANVHFPLSRKRVQTEGFDPAKDNPLAFLHPNEATVAEMFVLAQGNPLTAATMPAGTVRKYSVLRAGAFLTQFEQAFGFEMHPRHRKSLEMNPAWRCYVQKLQSNTREAVMDKLRNDGLKALERYDKAQVMAEKAGDYKELRIGAADHLDRIGATEKPTETVQNVVVVLKGRNFDAATLMAESPEIVVEMAAIPEKAANG